MRTRYSRVPLSDLDEEYDLNQEVEGEGKLMFCSIISTFGFIILFICSYFMYEESPYLLLGKELKSKDYEEIGNSTRIASYLYLLCVILSVTQIYLQRRVILTPPRLQTCLETTHIVEPQEPPKSE